MRLVRLSWMCSLNCCFCWSDTPSIYLLLVQRGLCVFLLFFFPFSLSRSVLPLHSYGFSLSFTLNWVWAFVRSFVRSSALVSVYLIVCSAFDCAVATNYVVRLLPNVREYLAICAIARCCFVCFVCIFFFALLMVFFSCTNMHNNLYQKQKQKKWVKHPNTFYAAEH